ncbi:hypothetical protein [Nitrosospira briensis]|uniref:hypothetical protein n=1 Tax=Nitrosospira briensis TaxID=35799 RepID=UPI001C4330F0|nr:hypothetical protein [Nitrosospira briensis]
MRMIVNIIYSSTGILIKSNADERGIHASGKTAANSRREKFGGHILSFDFNHWLVSGGQPYLT